MAAIEVGSHLYTTDFFQQSAFHDDHQIISIYYLIKSITPLDYYINNEGPKYPEKVGEMFRFIDWDYFSPEVMTLPIDKIAARILKEKI